MSVSCSTVDCRGVLLFVAVMLLTLTTMHLSVIIQTTRTEPVVVHPAHDDQRTYSHEELQHIVVRSLADVRAAEDAARTELPSSTTLPSTSAADPARLMEAAQTYAAVFSTRKSDAKNKERTGTGTGRRKDVHHRRSKRNVAERTGDPDVPAQMRQPSLASASGHHHLHVVSTTGISALDVSTTKPIGNATRPRITLPPPPPSPMFQPPDSDTVSSRSKRFSSVPQTSILKPVDSRSHRRSIAQHGHSVEDRRKRLHRNDLAAATGSASRPVLVSSPSYRLTGQAPTESSRDVQPAEHSRALPQSLGSNASDAGSGTLANVAPPNGDHVPTVVAEMASSAMMPLGTTAATVLSSQQQPLQSNTTKGKVDEGDALQLNVTSRGLREKG